MWTLRSGKAPVRPCHNLKCLQHYSGEVLIPPKDSVAQIQIWKDLRASPCSSCFLTRSCMTLVCIWITRTPEMYLMKESPYQGLYLLRNIVVPFFSTITTLSWGFGTYVSSWIGGCVLSESGIRLAQTFWLIVVLAKFSKHVSALISPLKQGQGVHSFCTHV